MDYDKEYNKLTDGYFKPTAGTYQVKILAEPTQISKTFNGDTASFWELPVLTNGQRLIWTIRIGGSKSSLYGQIVTLGKIKGQLKDVMLTLIVKQAGQTRDGKPKHDYTIPEAITPTTSEETIDTRMSS